MPDDKRPAPKKPPGLLDGLEQHFPKRQMVTKGQEGADPVARKESYQEMLLRSAKAAMGGVEELAEKGLNKSARLAGAIREGGHAPGPFDDIAQILLEDGDAAEAYRVQRANEMAADPFQGTFGGMTNYPSMQRVVKYGGDIGGTEYSMAYLPKAALQVREKHGPEAFRRFLLRALENTGPRNPERPQLEAMLRTTKETP